MANNAKKIIIITEKVILGGVLDIIEKAGATGYTITRAGGKGSRGIRPADAANVVDSFANVKIEVIVYDEKIAHQITEQVVDQYFENYSGITYMVNVEVLRPQKF